MKQEKQQTSEKIKKLEDELAKQKEVNLILTDIVEISNSELELLRALQEDYVELLMKWTKE